MMMMVAWVIMKFCDDFDDDDAATHRVRGICFHGSWFVTKSTFASDLYKSTTITRRCGRDDDDDDDDNGEDDDDNVHDGYGDDDGRTGMVVMAFLKIRKISTTSSIHSGQEG